MSTDFELRNRYVMAIDEVIPPAPWLEANVADVLAVQAQGKSRAGDGSGRHVLTPRLRFVAGLAVILIAIMVVSTLVFSARLRSTTVPSHRPTPISTPSPAYQFTPSPAVRGAGWPAGGQVPAALDGCWSQPTHPQFRLCLGGYSFDFVQGAVVGNVVVNGSEIDFISDVCTPQGTFGYDRYNFTLTDGTLVLTKFPTPGTGAWGNCGWKLPGSYTKQ